MENVELIKYLIFVLNILLGASSIVLFSKVFLGKNLLYSLFKLIQDNNAKDKEVRATECDLKKLFILKNEETKQIKNKLLKITHECFELKSNKIKIYTLTKIFNKQKKLLKKKSEEKNLIKHQLELIGKSKPYEKDKLKQIEFEKFKGFYPIESLLKGFLLNLRWYWFCIILLYLFLAIQFSINKKHQIEICLITKITTYVNSKSKKRVEWKKQYKNKIIKLDSLYIDSLKVKTDSIKHSLIENRLKLLPNYTLLRPDAILDTIFTSVFKQANRNLSIKEEINLMHLKKCFGADTAQYSKFKIKDSCSDNYVIDSIRLSIIDKVDSIFKHTFKYRNLILKIKPNETIEKDTLSIEKRVVHRYSDDLSKYTFNWLTNSVNTLSGLFLYLCYLALLLSTQERDDKKHIEISRSYKKGGIYIFVGLIFVDLLANIIDFYSAIDHKRLLQFLSYFSGLASSFTVFLLAGKLDSKLLNLGKCYYTLIIFLYVYGAIQPLFFVFSDGSDEAKAALMIIAFLLKVSLLFLFCHLLKSNKLLFFVYELRYLYNTQEKEFEKLEDLKEEYKTKN